MVTFLARDFSFDGPNIVPAGPATIRIVNTGKDLHNIPLVKLTEGRTPADLRGALQRHPVRLPPWAKSMGGSNTVVPGEQAEATLNLDEAGSYGLICLAPMRQGTPHVALGMQKPVQVLEPRSTALTQTAEFHLAFVDFEFVLPQRFEAGPHTVRVRNRGSQRPEVMLVELNLGATVHEFAAAYMRAAADPRAGLSGV